jgi:hypothetical protein
VKEHFFSSREKMLHSPEVHKVQVAVNCNQDMA